MLIFDKFPSEKHADKFALFARDIFNRETRVFLNQDEADKYDPFPFELVPPIVIVERERDVERRGKDEKLLEVLVVKFNGVFEGT